MVSPFAAAFDLMCVVRPDGTLLLANPSFKEATGISDEDCPMPITGLIHEDDRARFLACIASTPDKVEARLCGASKTFLRVEWRIHAHDESSVLLVGRDATERYVIQEQIGQYLIDLKRKTTEMEEFAYAAAHDIQEPLRTISNCASFIEEDCGATFPESAKESLGFIIEAAKHCRGLVRALLELSRLGSSASMGDVDVLGVVRKAVELQKENIQVSGASITADVLPVVRGDVSLLGLVFGNLISNALKFTKQDVPPVIYIGCEPGTAEHWHFIVQDRGAGIAPKYMRQVFQIFKRLDRTKPGTGVGLASCKRVVELHGGHIWLEGAVGQGVTVHFTLRKPEGMCGAVDTHPIGGRSQAGSLIDSKGVGEDECEASVTSRVGWRRGTCVLAEQGSIRRPTPTSSDSA